jgi:membrane-associated phospholipid phosphatase
MVHGRRAGLRLLSMGNVLHLLVDLDHDAIRATGELRWEPATVVLALLSAWWVKGPLLVAVGWGADLRCRRRFPLAALAATGAFFLASGLNVVLKAIVDRSRPPQEIGLHALVGVPGSPSFPSGHAMTAFAVAGAIALIAPRLRRPVLVVAAAIAFSRVYLGVHFWLDVLVGSALGLAIGLGCAAALRRAVRPSPAPVERRPARALPAHASPARAAPRA